MFKPPKISFLRSLNAAMTGVRDAVLEQRNLRIHICVAVFVVALAGMLQISSTQWALLALCVGMVIGAEFINTAIETVVDLASPEYHELARKAKDMSAAAVLVLSMTAACVGVIVLWEPLLLLIAGAF
ncbi:diacylglycerol kinase family protein [Planctomicrobium sp. SH668]|uniref:diacylglycerol kinase family protein n=1 Tax=Planctomicrobium sp. SH668 TaxID=3448126 RepID=UPI003F5C5FCD